MSKSRANARLAEVPIRHMKGTLNQFLFSYTGKPVIQQRANTSVISTNELRNIREQIQASKFNKSMASVVGKGDLERVKTFSVVKDKTQLQAEKLISDEQRTKRMAVSIARKNRMKTQDRERAANALPQVRSTNFGENTLLAKAQDQMDEDYDDVKHMNQMVLASKICTVRDRQIEENKHLEQNWVEEQKRLDTMMEIERLKALKAEHDREFAAAQARKRGAQVLIDQIASRQEVRQREEEVREMEKATLMSNIEKIRQEELQAQQDKKMRIQIMNDEVKIANKNALGQKEQSRITEKELDNKIAAHQRRTVEREEAQAREYQRVKEEKEREVQRLRELQERQQDRAAALDQIRAQKAHEKAEQQNREQEEAKKQKYQQELSKLHVERRIQFADNDRRLKTAQGVERQQHMVTVNRIRQQECEEREYMAARRNAFLTYKQQLNSQMQKNEELRQNDKHSQAVESKKTRLLIDQERNRIEMIKAQKLSGVQSLGVQDRYTQDLMKKKISF